MYDNVISKAVKNNLHQSLENPNMTNKFTSAGSGRINTSGANSAMDGRVNVASCTTSTSMRSDAQMPHLVPQKTNVLTGA